MSDIVLSIIVPCYNEESRGHLFLEKLVRMFGRSGYEIIIVNDGSTDGTENIIYSITRGVKNARIISYKENMGKGVAVKTGIMSAKGDYIIFIDADGSIDPEEIKNMEKLLKNYDVVVGTRASKVSVVKKQPTIRRILGVLFNSYVNMIFGIRIKDSLCGFKGFKADAAKYIFSKLYSSRWIFDVEVFYRIRKKNYRLYQMPIHWVHKENTKMSSLDPIKMFIGVLVLRLKMLRR